MVEGQKNQLKFVWHNVQIIKPFGNSVVYGTDRGFPLNDLDAFRADVFLLCCNLARVPGREPHHVHVCAPTVSRTCFMGWFYLFCTDPAQVETANC